MTFILILYMSKNKHCVFVAAAKHFTLEPNNIQQCINTDRVC